MALDYCFGGFWWEGGLEGVALKICGRWGVMCLRVYLGSTWTTTWCVRLLWYGRHFEWVVALFELLGGDDVLSKPAIYSFHLNFRIKKVPLHLHHIRSSNSSFEQALKVSPKNLPQLTTFE